MAQAEDRAWAAEQFAHAALGDERRVRRATTLATQFLERPGSSIPALFARRYDVKAAYRFFAHPQVTPETLQAGHRAQLQERLHAPGQVVLLPEDTTTFSWSGNQARSGLGPIGHGSPGLQGCLVHSVLMLEWSAAGEAAPGQPRPALPLLGLADQQYRARPEEKQRSRESDSRAAKERFRESEIWSQATLRLGQAPEQTRWVRVCDREADIYEFLLLCQEWGHGFVVRATQDRRLEWSAADADEPTARRLFGYLRAQPAQGCFPLSLRSRGKQQPAREASLSVAWSAITLRSPLRPGKAPGSLPGIRCTAVRIWEADPPAKAKPLEWILLVDQPVASFEEAQVCAQQYSARWLIEEYHKVLKTGLGAERLQLETAERLYAAIALLSVVAVRLLALKERVRIDPFAPAEASGLSPAERQLLGLHLRRELKTVRDVILALGRLGGHMGAHQGTRVDHLPGWLTLWRGMQTLNLMMEGARLAKAQPSFGV